MDDKKIKNVEEFFSTQLERTNYWLSFAEAKNAGLLAINIAIIGILMEKGKILEMGRVAVLLCLLASSIICIVSFYPNMKSKEKKKKEQTSEAKNLVFYRDIAEFESEEKYTAKVLDDYFGINREDTDATNRDDVSALSADLAAEVFINSKITVRKYSTFRWAVILDIVALAGLALLLVIA